jgi:hypothetical protein
VRRLSILFILFLAATFLAAPALALDTKLSGFYRARGIVDNFVASNNFIGTLTDDAEDESLVDQRLRLKLDAMVNDYLSFTYYAEVDFQWGDNQYANARNDGGALGGDTVNLESKHVYIDVKVPDTNVSARLGLQGLDDHWDWTFVTADMAGAKFNLQYDAASITAGWFKLLEGDFDKSDDITLWALQVETAASPNLKGGVDYYYYQNQGATTNEADPTLKNQQYGSFFGTADIEAVLAFNKGSDSWTGQREDMDLHYIGLHGEYRMRDVVLKGWALGNFGTVDNIMNDTATPGLTDDIDVEGWGGTVQANTNVCGVTAGLRGLFFSGDDDLTDGDAGFFVNPLATETFAFATDGFMIFFPDVYWTSIGQYGFAMVDAAWAGYGLWGGTLNASYTPAGMDKFNIKGGVAYVASLEDKLATGDPRSDRNGTSLGTEAFLRASYEVSENLVLSANGAYAWLGDFYDDQGGGTAVNDPAEADPDNPYEVYLMADLHF